MRAAVFVGGVLALIMSASAVAEQSPAENAGEFLLLAATRTATMTTQTAGVGVAGWRERAQWAMVVYSPEVGLTLE